MNTTGKEGYWPIVQGLRPGLNDGEEEQFLKLLRVNSLTHFNLRGGVGVHKALVPKGAEFLVCLVISLEETFSEYFSLSISCHDPPTLIHGNDNLHSVLPFACVYCWPGACTCLLSFASVAGVCTAYRRISPHTTI